MQQNVLYFEILKYMITKSMRSKSNHIYVFYFYCYLFIGVWFNHKIL